MEQAITCVACCLGGDIEKRHKMLFLLLNVACEWLE